MIQMTLSQIAAVCNGELVGPDAAIGGVSIDTRTLNSGDLYIAIRGERFDGHEFITNAEQAGAIACVADRDVSSQGAVIRVANTRQALGDIAKHHRQQQKLKLVALTGSCGKTTTKTLLASILAVNHQVHATKGTLNNDIGVPLTLLDLKNSHEYAVIEMGANHPGEIHYLSEMAEADCALITSIHPVHLEGFGSLNGVAQAKGEIFATLKPGAIMIYPHGSPYQSHWQNAIDTQPSITFGKDPAATVYYSDLQQDVKGHSIFDLHYQGDSIEIHLPLLAEHNVLNACASASCALAMGLSLQEVKLGLESAQAVSGRLNTFHLSSGAFVIDDSYNANPAAVTAAIDVLLTYHRQKKVLVLGEMGELGEESATYHAEVGRYAKSKGIDLLLAYGEQAKHAVSAFGEGGQYFTDHNSLCEVLLPHCDNNMSLLIKGSRSTHLESVVNTLKNIPVKESTC